MMMLLIYFVEESRQIIPSPESSGAESLINTAVLWLVLLAEVVAAILIGMGILLTLVKLIRVLQKPKYEGYEKTRLTLARFLAIALEFQLAADVLATAVAPSWTQIGKLGAIAVIRTALNYFLEREIKSEEEGAAEIHPLASDA